MLSHYPKYACTIYGWYSDGKNTHKYTQQVNNRRAEILFPRDRFVIHVKKSHPSKLWDFGINTFLEFFQVSKWNDSGTFPEFF